MRKTLFALCALLMATIFSLQAQDPIKVEVSPVNVELIRNELDARGLQDVEVSEIVKRMKAKGIDVDNPKPEDADKIERAFGEIMEDLEREKAATPSQPGGGNKPKEDTADPTPSKGNEGQVNPGDKFDDDVERDEFEISEDELRRLVYGQHIFANQKLKAFNQNTGVKPPPSYVLGEGDEIIVNIAGENAIHSGRYEIEGGKITPAGMKPIYLNGLSLAQAKKIIRKSFRQFYSFEQDEMVIGLNFSRTITVNIVGAVRRYGPHNIPALNTAYTALIAAKGPTAMGSVRNIKLIRDGESPRNFDIYEYLMDPSKERDFFLQNNDYVHVPTVGKVVAIEGAIRRPFKYELKDSEHLKQLIYWAGGLQSTAYKKSIRVLRYVDDEHRIITVDLGALEKSGKDFELLNGDRITIPTIPSAIQNFVSIEGAVEIQGDFQYVKGMRISDLIYKGVLTDNAHLEEAMLFRERRDAWEDNITIKLSEILSAPGSATDSLLRPKDRILIYDEDIFVNKNALISITGAVRRSQKYPYTEDLKLSQIITYSGGLTEDATGEGYIFRRDPNSREKADYVKINVSDAISNIDGTSNLVLEPMDSVVIFSYSDNPENAIVSIGGAVYAPSEFPYDSGMTLRDLLSFARGLKLSADNAKIMVYRVRVQSGQATVTEEIELEIDEDMNVIGAQTGEFELLPFDRVIVRQTPDFELQQNVTVNGEVRYPGAYSLIKPNERLSDVLERAGGFKETAMKEGVTLYRARGDVGHLVIDVEDILADPDSPSNYVLKEGDVINIPKESNFVAIIGFTNAKESLSTEVVEGNNRINVPYIKGKTAKYYIDKYAGGINRDAGAKNRLIKVRQPGGKLEKTKDYGFFKKYPTVKKGAIIMVEAKIKTEEQREKEKVDWGEVISNTVAQATAILTLVILIQNIQQ